MEPVIFNKISLLKNFSLERKLEIIYNLECSRKAYLEVGSGKLEVGWGTGCLPACGAGAGKLDEGFELGTVFVSIRTYPCPSVVQF